MALSSIYTVLGEVFLTFCFPKRVNIVICSSEVAYNSGINSFNNFNEKLCQP